MTVSSSPKEVQAIASKGGQASHNSGFASMDPDKQREIASKGGQASGGSFEPGSDKASRARPQGGIQVVAASTAGNSARIEW
ncbi:hypothetical protein MY10362_008233 [Beauveria mimosiformis]